MELNIYHLYPDVLNLYGDRGNVLCMQRRLEWRGMQANVFPVPIGTKFIAKDCDLIFIGGGQDFEQEILMHDLKGEKTAELKAAIEDGIPVLAICGGYQMLGQYYKTWDGKQCDFTGALDLYTVGSEQRMIGNYMFTCEEADCKIVGFENHSGKTYLGSGVKPLGKILEGYGNNGEDGTEGAHYKTCSARIHTALCCRKIRSWPTIFCASRSSANTAKQTFRLSLMNLKPPHTTIWKTG